MQIPSLSLKGSYNIVLFGLCETQLSVLLAIYCDVLLALGVSLSVASKITCQQENKEKIRYVEKIIVGFFFFCSMQPAFTFHKIKKFIPPQVATLTSDFKTCVSL